MLRRFALLTLFISAPAIAAPHATGYIRKEADATTQFQTRGKGLAARAVLPLEYDACAEGYCGPTRNQGQCGSCWAHGLAAAFEAALHAKDQTKLVDLAEQDQLVNDRSNYGCNGGFLDATWQTKAGQTTEDLCPYKASGRYACKGAKYAKAATWGLIGTRSRAPSIEELKEAILNYKVLAVTVAASGGFGSPNSEGRITSCGSRSVNHIVALVGYRTMGDGTTEFKVRNSWGKSWGKGGYAWSRQGCNRLASSVGDAALFISMGK